MQALVKSKDSEGLWLEEVPEPELGHDDVLFLDYQDNDPERFARTIINATS